MTTPGPAPADRRIAAAGLWLRLQLFLTSYAPLALIFAWQSETLQSRIGWTVAFVVMAFVGLRLTYLQLRKVALSTRLESVEDRGGEVAGYLATYLLPFIAGPPSSWGQVGAYCTYFVVAAVVYVQSNLIFLNPTLYLFGWRVVEASTAGRKLLMLCREVPQAPVNVDLVRLLDGAVRKDRGSN